MFETESRYYSLQDAEHIKADGRVVTYKCRRFLPRGEEMPLLVEVAIAQSDRLDLISFRMLGSAEHFWRICDANNAMNPFELTAVTEKGSKGRILRVPVPEI
jgi:hypothetical protein